MARLKGEGGRRTKKGWTPLASNKADLQRVEQVPETPQSLSPSYRLAFADMDFLSREELRPVRLQLELLKTEMLLEERGIESTVVLFGGARIPEPGAEPRTTRQEPQRSNLKKASVYYDEARNFARICSTHSASLGFKEYVIVTGGGPGVMEAGNRGAADVGAPSIGLNIVLPHEQAPNIYVTPELAFNFHYFAIRKMHFLMRAKAVVVFPGGFGTLDEMFETLTLIQTRRMAPIPLILFGEKFWRNIINFTALAEFGTISADDLALVNFVETAEQAWAVIGAHYDRLAQPR